MMIHTQPTESAPQFEDLSKMSAPARWRRALAALAKIVADPERTDQVLVFSHYINGYRPEATARFFESADGRRLYDEHRAIDSAHVDLDALAALPADTLGHAYAHFLRSRGFTPDVFQAPEGIPDPHAAYVIQRIRQSHDLWHVVTGHTTEEAGEIALQAFTFGQLRAPSSLIIAAVGTVRGIRHRPTLAREAFAAYMRGRHAERFSTFPWEDHWTTPLAQVRALLAVEPVTGSEFADTAAATAA